MYDDVTLCMVSCTVAPVCICVCIFKYEISVYVYAYISMYKSVCVCVGSVNASLAHAPHGAHAPCATWAYAPHGEFYYSTGMCMCMHV
jgi:hypothetical protein